MAQCELRRMPDVMNEVSGTIAILKLINYICWGY